MSAATNQSGLLRSDFQRVRGDWCRLERDWEGEHSEGANAHKCDERTIHIFYSIYYKMCFPTYHPTYHCCNWSGQVFCGL